MANISDQEILRVLGSDPRAGTHLLFDKYYTLLVVYAERFLHDRGRAEDVVQEFFIRLWSDASRREMAIRALPPYLYAGVRNACLTSLSARDFPRDPAELSGVEIPVETFTGIDDERVERVLREIERLPERTRLVVKAVMLEEQKYKEVAERLSISINTVKFLLKEGTRRLREKLVNGAQELLFIFFRKING
jgi:RNA polymerase sigma-70 factor (ECF subfamily)